MTGTRHLVIGEHAEHFAAAGKCPAPFCLGKHPLINRAIHPRINAKTYRQGT